MYVHTRQTRKKYLKKNQGDATLECNFCQGITADQVVRETEHCLLIRNRVPYDLWEHHKVLEHLLVVPKRHVHLLSELAAEEQLDAMQLYGEHEALGYNIYARASDSPRRSAHHQHTHLIRIDHTVARGGVYLKKPFINITF